jgi:hypothetical protein
MLLIKFCLLYHASEVAAGQKKQGVIEKLLKFFEKYFGIVNQELISNPIQTSEYQNAVEVAEKPSEYNGY